MMRFAIAFVTLLASSAASAQWTGCASEGGVCRFDGQKQVTYGGGDKWVTKTFSGGVACNNGVFGDPAPGVKKSCSFRNVPTGQKAAPNWVFCAKEGQVCRFSGDRNVSYGANKQFKFRVFRNGVTCINDNFGDPAVGVAKSCYYDAS